MKKRAKQIAKILITIILAYFFIVNNDISQIIISLKRISLGVWVMSFVLTMISVIIATIKWRVLLPEFSFKDLLFINWITGFYSLILPGGQLSSEGVRAYLFGKKHNNLEIVSASVIVDKITGLIALMILGMIGLLASGFTVSNILIVIFFLVTFGICVGLYLLRITKISNLINKFLDFIGKKLKKRKNIPNRIKKLFEDWCIYTKNNKLIIKSILWGGIFQLLSAISCTLFSYGVGVNIAFYEWFWINAILTVALLIPISIAGIGVREGTLIGVLGMLGVTSDKALSISMALLIVQIFRAVIGGVLELLRTYEDISS